MLIKDRYEYDPTTDLVGKGGFARVFRARDTLLKREVALKVFAPTGADHYSVLAEIRKAIQLEHPNLLRYYDVVLLGQTNALGEEEEVQIGVLEYANAGDLKNYVRANPNSPHLPRFLREVLLGLEYLHGHGIIHRDLKAQNILLVERQGQLTAKISDFGISKSLASDDARSSSMLVGTIEYMAPEQFNPRKFGIDGRVGPNVDLWGFGVMVHELLTDSTPFGRRGGETTAEQIMAAILDPELPSEIHDLSEPYREVVRKCLVAHARERIQKASELLAYFGEPTLVGKEAGVDDKAPAPTVTEPVTAKEPEDDDTQFLRVDPANHTSDPKAPHEPADTQPVTIEVPGDAGAGTTLFEPQPKASSPSPDQSAAQLEQKSKRFNSRWAIAIAAVLIALALFLVLRPGMPAKADVTDASYAAQISSQAGAKRYPSGWITQMQAAGTGLSPRQNDYVLIRLALTKANGTEVWYDGKETNVLALSSLMPGLVDLVREMKVGGRAKFWLPATAIDSKLLPQPLAGVAVTPSLEKVTWLAGSVELLGTGEREELESRQRKVPPPPEVPKQSAQPAVPNEDRAKTDTPQLITSQAAKACHQECSTVQAAPSVATRTGNVGLEPFAYPMGTSIPQDRARDLAQQACSRGGGSLSTYSAQIDGQCGGNVCFARVTASCVYRQSVPGASQQVCKSVCN